MKSNVFVGIKSHDFMESDKYQDKYDYMLVPITNNRYRDAVKICYGDYKLGKKSRLEILAPQLQDLGAPTRRTTENGVGYIGLIASWLELESPDRDIAELSFQVLKYEFDYARCFGIKQVILAPPRNLNNLNLYAQKIARLLRSVPRGDNFKTLPLLSISLPLFEDSDPFSTWELWNTISKLCNNHPCLTVTLAIPRHRTPRYVLNRWLAEPVSCLLVSSSIFVTNQYDYPVLNRYNQELITSFQQINGNAESTLGELTIILHGIEKYVNNVRGGETIYLDYINYLLKKGDKAIVSSAGSVDAIPRIMPPLQPHSTNLSNDVYHTFEEETAKYDMYEIAIGKALQKLVNDMKNNWKRNTLSILVAGAGRGPLVDRTLQCLKRLKIANFKLIALEKNPHALLYLQKKNFENWAQAVEIAPVDMREWNSNIKIDLCISELLGSFGCNELSPECLQPLEKRNCTSRTIFIPESYTSYVAIVSTPLVYQKLKKLESSAFESPWVIHNIPYCILSSKVNELWTFKHPNNSASTARSVITNLTVKHRSEVHGLVGYFTANLFGNIELSILPPDCPVKLLGQSSSDDSNSAENYKKSIYAKNMNSWSPIFFPLKKPLFVTDNTEMELHMSRNIQDDKVWYEWSLDCFIYNVVNEGAKYVGARREVLMNSHKNGKMTYNYIEGSDYMKQLKRKADAFTKFQPVRELRGSSEIDSTEAIIESQVDNNTDSNEMYEETFTGNEFETPGLNGWRSIRDIHGLEYASTSFFEEQQVYEDREDGDTTTYEEYHLRIRTDVTELHNLGGIAHCIKL
ncbi:HBL100Cp [Eremothecium sinecaudum]|uniref:HBL100Cp n=1 Tax=Eremothecium sinecaudum TaxID=45286 RepID=A0A109UX79_9SACH|nr:HBL100Cp [Eremothecium sinecaudum]AMD18802.1 HBL100Cp [Eremothecium sinecaudum]